MSKARTFQALLIGCLLTAALGAQQGSLSGRVFDAASGEGIPALTIQLESPKAQGTPPIVTYTDADGRFNLSLSPGRYLLTVSQGPTPIHREVVDVAEATTKEIALNRG